LGCHPQSFALSNYALNQLGQHHITVHSNYLAFFTGVQATDVSGLEP